MISKLFTIFLISFLSFNLLADQNVKVRKFEHTPKWIAHEKYVSNKNIDKAFQMAQEHFLENNKNKGQKVDYEYYVSSTEKGFIVFITPMYLSQNGKYSFPVDGERCIYVNKSFNIIGGIWSCLTPDMDLLLNEIIQDPNR